MCRDTSTRRRDDLQTRATLVLLEMPPLTYFACGSLEIPAFFQSVIARVACGLVLDIGHLWTVYRYTGAWRGRSWRPLSQNFWMRFPWNE